MPTAQFLGIANEARPPARRPRMLTPSPIRLRPMKRKFAPRKKTPAKKSASPRSLSRTRSRKSRSTAATIAPPSHVPAFREVLLLIERARHRASHAGNTELIDLFRLRHHFDGFGYHKKVSALLTQLQRPQSRNRHHLPPLIRRSGESPRPKN